MKLHTILGAGGTVGNQLLPVLKSKDENICRGQRAEGGPYLLTRRRSKYLVQEIVPMISPTFNVSIRAIPRLEPEGKAAKPVRPINECNLATFSRRRNQNMR